MQRERKAGHTISTQARREKMAGTAKATVGEFCRLARKPFRETAKHPLIKAKGSVDLPQVFVFRVAAFLAAPRARGARGATVVAYKKQAK